MSDQDLPALPPELEDQLWPVLDLPAVERSSAVERLTAAHPAHATAIQRFVRELGRLAPLGSGEPPVMPTEIGPYRLVRELGRGGFGVVFLGERTEPVRQQVAIKLIKLGMDSQAIVRRFAQERQALALMSHDTIAKVFDCGTTERGQPYFVMEYIPGIPLTTWCDAHAATVEQRIRLLQAVCAGVQHAHQKFVVHRDLTPRNILVAEVDGRPVPKIIDFGLAKALDERGGIRVTKGLVIGTPGYMAPEQADPDNVDVDTRADVYSLGVILYELLAGELPVAPETPKPSSRVSTQNAAAMAQKRGATAATLARQLRGDLDWITLKAIERDRARRYGSPQELAADLERHLRHEPVLAGPPSTAYRVRKFVRRSRGQVAATALVLGVTIAGAIIGTTFWLRAQANLDRFLLVRDRVRLDEAIAQEGQLWPAFPDKAAAMREWIEQRAEPLRQRLPALRAARDAMRKQALPWSAEEQARDREEHPNAARLWELEHSLTHVVLPASGGSRPGLSNAESEALQTEREKLRARVGERRTFSFADDAERFLHDAVSGLVADLEAFTGEKGQIAAVQRRRCEAESVWKETIEDHRAEWDRAIAAIAAHPKYGGLRLTPQVGLVPLGPDPDSTLWEFGHPRSGTVPRRGTNDKLELTDDMGIVFVLLPGGTFTMGAQRKSESAENYDPQERGDEGPPHPVRLAPFFLGKYELTQGQWKQLTGGEEPSFYRIGKEFRVLINRPGYPRITERQPVESVTWWDCDKWLRRHGLILPTEAQWEFACRAGTSAPWSTGNDANSLKGHANVLDLYAASIESPWVTLDVDFRDGFAGPAPVGTYKPNAWGLLDMHGNLWEWCRDEYWTYGLPWRTGDGLRELAAGRPKSSSVGRVYRGGSFNYPARDARSSVRGSNPPSNRATNIGVRPARVTAVDLNTSRPGSASTR